MYATRGARVVMTARRLQLKRLMRCNSSYTGYSDREEVISIELQVCCRGAPRQGKHQ